MLTGSDPRAVPLALVTDRSPARSADVFVGAPTKKKRTPLPPAWSAAMFMALGMSSESDPSAPTVQAVRTWLNLLLCVPTPAISR